ncbi:MAG: relaxase/mobilization nuclease domain-containing protein [Pirellulales bacterium]
MIPKIHAKGHSFRGVAQYVLHDKDRADTDDRVAWFETRNLATDDANVAWRVMAATAMNQDLLKEAAGIKKTGRKSSAHVLHYTLSWHADEAEGLTRDEMLRAVEGSLEALGRSPTDDREGQLASEHQALIVCHNDEPQPHVHVIVNRVHPEHGVMLPRQTTGLPCPVGQSGTKRNAATCSASSG